MNFGLTTEHLSNISLVNQTPWSDVIFTYRFAEDSIESAQLNDVLLGVISCVFYVVVVDSVILLKQITVIS